MLGRWLGISAKNQRRLIPVGVAAGIAAAFNAPIAAVTFTIEEVVGNLDQAVLSGVIVAAALAAVIERSILGENAIFRIPETYGLRHPSALILYAVIGIAAALISVAFTESLLALRARFQAMRAIPLWARPGIGGAVTGALAVACFASFGTRGITGGGYSVLGRALTGELAGRVLLSLCVAKLVATVFSYSSGGAGGIFAPSLFIGGTLGGAIGLLNAAVLGRTDEPIGAFALVGMGAVFSGVIRAPITSVLIIIELTKGYSLILPLMIANMTAYMLARHWRPRSIYEALLEQDGVRLASAHGSDTLEGVSVASVLDPSRPVCELRLAMGSEEVQHLALTVPNQHVFPVLDSQRRLLGIVTSEELRSLASEPLLAGLVTASDVMRGPASIAPDDDLRTALEVMLANGIRKVPVTDEAGVLIGFVDEAVVARAYVRQKGGSHQGNDASRSQRPNSPTNAGHG